LFNSRPFTLAGANPRQIKTLRSKRVLNNRFDLDMLFIIFTFLSIIFLFLNLLKLFK
jgi:hypothetical protein